VTDQQEPRQIRARGGLRNRRGNVTWPLALLIAEPNRIVLKGLLGGARFDTPQRVKISPHDGITAIGLRFAPEDLRSEALTFWTARRDELVQQLRQLGWGR
jgi:hypothetical protein